ncbi:cucumber peeling cupredoxin-like [Rhodamnia argentea]|uniref:Cucumber peeling cupredoxin-like n=1 Tax=Rhodamnia argentea TaxID=178133 RepID=A0ABM3HCC9_9MYRT|nr:cucumber peeling cupredoxin-like [Rhodamnia argentea]
MGRGAVSAGFLAIAMLACLGGAATATEYVVGGSRGWTAPPNITAGYYDEWAAGKAFTGGDTLRFIWNGRHNVAVVNREEYDSCTKVSSVSQGGETFNYTLPADANGLYYFICTVDSHCENGQKLAITVVSPTPAESPNSSGSSSSAVGALPVLVLLSSSIISMLMN